MAKNRFAQPLYGKIVYIYETDLTMEQLSTIFSPKTYWIDVTGIDCEVGYIQEFREGEGVVWVAPPNEVLTLEDVKENKKAEMKAIRDNAEEAVIEYNGSLFDYDEKARERLSKAEKYMTKKNLEGMLWTLADNTRAVITVADIEDIDCMAAERSAALHDQYNSLKDYIDTLETIEEVQAITFNTAVPESGETVEEV